jgi:predicted permease
MSGATIGRLYGVLLRLLPARFRARFAPEMRRMFEEQWRDSGAAARAGIALRAVVDVGWTALLVRLNPGAYASAAGRGEPAATPASPFSGLATDALAAVRGLRRRPAFAATAAVTAALGIGATTAVFSVADATVLHGLGMPDEARLVSVWGTFARVPGQPFPLSVAEYADVRAEMRSLDRVGAWGTGDVVLEPRGDRPARTVGAAYTYGDVYAIVGARAALGRLPGPADDRPDAPAVAVLSDGLWRSAFGGDPRVVGTATVPAGRRRALIVGVLAPGVALPGSTAELWVHQAPPTVSPTADRSGHILTVIGRLRPGATAPGARAELSALQGAWAARYAGRHSFGIDGHVVRAESLGARVLGTARRVALLLSAASAGLLLLACVNVAGLLLARGEARTSEVGVRIAMGAPAGRVARPVLLEGLAIALAGGALGLTIAALGLPALLRLAPPELAGRVPARVDPRAVGFALAASLLTGALFTLAPARRAARRDPSALLRAGGRGRTGAMGGLRWLVGGQAALAALLLVGAALLARSLGALTAVDPGFDPRGRVALDLSLPPARYGDAPTILRFYDELLARVTASRGVARAALVRNLPLRDAQRHEYVLREGAAAPDGLVAVSVQTASAGVLRTLGIPLLRGRDLGPGDRAGAVRGALINASAARTLWPGESAIGKRVHPTFLADSVLVTVVGVYGDVRSGGLATAPTPELLLPVAQGDVWPGFIRSLTLVVQGAGASTLPALRAAVRAVDPNVAVDAPTTLDAVLRAGAARQRFLAALLAAFAGLALAIAAVGVFSAVSFMVARQTRELAIRAALGAGRGSTVRLVVRTSAGVAGAGAAVGALAAAAASPALAGFLYGVSPHDAAVFVGVPLALVGVAVLACLAPAVRAMRVSPAHALQDTE